MFVRFEYNKEDPERFFTDELPSLVECLALLLMTGAVIDSVDLENRRIFMKIVEKGEESAEEERILPVKEVEKVGKVCNTCTHYQLGDSNTKGYCHKNDYTSDPTDTCEHWTN